MRILDTFITSSSHFMACCQLPIRDIRQRALFWKEKAAKSWVSKRVCYRAIVIDSHWILLGVHIDDFVIVGADQIMLDALRKRLLEAFEGTYEGLLEHYLGCEIARDHITSTTTLSQKHYAKEIL